MTAKNLYAYTLQPVNYEITEAEQRDVQLKIWRSTNQIGMKAWAIMAAVTILSIVGIILLKNYSTIFCWVALVCVLIYFLIRQFGLEWYVKRKMNEFPVQEIKGIRLGVQPHGLAMRQKMGLQEGTGVVSWKDVYEWYNTPDFILMKFKVKGQEGAYILPARMDSKNFSFATIRKHLNEVAGEAKSL